MLYHNNQMVLGIDMGNYNMKTANVCFPSAYMELAGDENDFEHTITYNGKHYALGGHESFSRRIRGLQKIF